MSISSHKQKTKKNSFQRKVQALQLERDELREKLLEYESELAGQIERFNSAEQEYKSKIYRLERKLQLQRHEETPILQTRIMNWIFFGVVCSILPLVMSILYIWFLGYNITLTSIISDFLLVLFAVSINLMSILFDSDNRSSFSRIIYMFLTIFSLASLELSIMLLSTPTLSEINQTRISTIFLFALISLIIVAILGVIFIVWRAKK